MNERLKFEDLERFCNDHEPESLSLEFKSCNALKLDARRANSVFLDELTKDVTAFLNAAGGRIIYGIQENDSRADSIDRGNAFSANRPQDNVDAERVTQWLRAHIKPSPPINAYAIYERPDASNWYLVIDIEQGQTAHAARDRRFYKRVGNIVQVMEQYEVADAINRMRSPALELKMEIKKQKIESRNHDWLRLDIYIGVTSANYIAAEYGALRLSFTNPVQLMPQMINDRSFENRDLVIEGQTDAVKATSMCMRWNTNLGVVFPGDWYDFHGNGAVIHIPRFTEEFTYLVQADLLCNGRAKTMLFSLESDALGSPYKLVEVTPTNYEEVLRSFWGNYKFCHTWEMTMA